MKTLLATLMFTLAVSLTAPADDKKTDDKKDENKAASTLEGGYTLVSGEKDGKVIPPERIKGSIVKFTGKVIVGTDKDKKEFFASTYTLDTSKKPWVITMKSTSPKEATAMGIIKKDGDTLTIAYALPGTATPTEFKTKENQHLFVLKAMGKDEKEPKEPNKFIKD